MDLILHDSDLVLERGTLEQNGVTVRYCLFLVASRQWIAAGTTSDATIIAGMGTSASEAVASLTTLITEHTTAVPLNYDENAIMDDSGDQTW